MKATEFCYWLQGAFELGNLAALTKERLQCIKQHLAMVQATDQATQPAKVTEFCAGLRGGLDFIKPGDSLIMEALRKRLHDCFVHAIDPNYPNSDELNYIHGGTDENGNVVRC